MSSLLLILLHHLLPSRIGGRLKRTVQSIHFLLDAGGSRKAHDNHKTRWKNLSRFANTISHDSIPLPGPKSSVNIAGPWLSLSVVSSNLAVLCRLGYNGMMRVSMYCNSLSSERTAKNCPTRHALGSQAYLQLMEVPQANQSSHGCCHWTL